MSLANLIQTAKYDTVLPVSKQVVQYRPFLVKEQRALLQAQMDNNHTTSINTIQDVLKACTFDRVEIEKLTPTDFEWLMLQVRSKAVGDEIRMNLTCPHCHKTQLHISSITDVAVTEPNTNVINPVQLDTNLYVDIQLPSVKQALTIKDKNPIDIITDCIKSVLYENEIYEAANTAPGEMREFVDSLTTGMLSKIKDYIESTPQVYLDIKTVCDSCQSPIETRVQGVLDFLE